jgi:hypothetical protein
MEKDGFEGDLIKERAANTASAPAIKQEKLAPGFELVRSERVPFSGGRVLCDGTIEEGATLELGEGTMVALAGGSRVYNHGRIRCSKNRGEPSVFMALGGGWYTS